MLRTESHVAKPPYLFSHCWCPCSPDAPCYGRSCSLGFHREIVTVLLCPPVLPTCFSSQVLTSSPGGPPCLHLCPSSHPGGYGRNGHSCLGTPSALASEGIPAGLLASANAGLSSLEEHCPGASISLHLGLATHVWTWQ